MTACHCNKTILRRRTTIIGNLSPTVLLYYCIKLLLYHFITVLLYNSITLGSHPCSDMSKNILVCQDLRVSKTKKKFVKQGQVGFFCRTPMAITCFDIVINLDSCFGHKNAIIDKFLSQFA